MTWFAVLVGGALGSAARHAVNVACGQFLNRPVPYATAVVNLVGAGVIGLLAGMLASGRLEMSAPMRGFVFVGILGGFTTFSSFVLDTLTLSYGGEPGLAFINLAAQTILGLAVVWAGYYLGAV